MNALRGIALFLLQCLMTPVVLALMMLVLPLGGPAVYGLARRWCQTNVLVGRLLGLRYRIEYEEAPARGTAGAGPVVILAKHSSAWETFFIVGHFPRLVPVVKRELLWVPFFGWGLALCRPISIDRSVPREARAQLQEQGVARARDGLSIMIFPEGTRIPPGHRGRYAAGGAGLAMAAGIPVVALAHDAGYFWRKSLFDKRAGTIQVRISAPMLAQPGESAADLTRRAEHWIEAQIESFGHPPAQRTPAALAAWRGAAADAPLADAPLADAAPADLSLADAPPADAPPAG